eukprot:m.53348 g.53348  ORF g.53348 m.53348 type:complete len:173 (+) comp34244_c0_seq6:985-1503(+)
MLEPLALNLQVQATPSFPSTSFQLSAVSNLVAYSSVEAPSIVTSLVPAQEKTAEKSKGETEKQKKRKGGWPKGKKRKEPSLFNPPKVPVTGYVHFMNAKREEIRKQHPDLSSIEITRILGTMWTSLAQDEKQKFLEEAGADKRRVSSQIQEIYFVMSAGSVSALFTTRRNTC